MAAETPCLGCEVLVVGAGPAGAAAGIVLARAGVEVCVVDRARFPRPKPCGDALSNRAVSLLVELAGAGAGLETLPRAVVRGAAVVFPDGGRVERRYERPGWIAPRRELDLLLRDRLLAEGARVIEGVPVRGLTRGADGRFDGAVGDGHRWRARAVIAADGPGSVAWRALGIARPRGRQLALAATAYVRGASTSVEGVSEHHLDPELACGYGWVFPAVEGLTNVGVFQRADLLRRSSSSLQQLLVRFLARRGIDPRQLDGVRVRAWPLPICTAPIPAAAEGLLLCGDAGRFVDPLTGEGIWQALHTGTIAGRIVAAALAVDRSLTRAWVRRYQRSCAREIGWPSVARSGIQELLRRLVDHRLHRHAAVRRLLQWGYGRGALEVSKTSAASTFGGEPRGFTSRGVGAL